MALVAATSWLFLTMLMREKGFVRHSDGKFD